MSSVALGSARHSPGATTTALALAAAWPAHRRLLVVEADPAGGDLICLYGLMAEPNLLTLAADARSSVPLDSLWANAQQLPGRPGVAAVVAPIDPAQARAAVATLVRAGLGQTLAGHGEVDVVVDVGRLDPDSPAMELFASVGTAVMVARSTLGQAAHLQKRIGWFGRDINLVVIGSGPWKPEELAANVGAAGVVGFPDDARGAAALHAPGQGAKALQRSSLWRAARPMVQRLADVAASPPPPVPEALAARPGMAWMRGAER